MEHINYHKLQYDITRNKHFTMIWSLPLSSKHLLTLKGYYQCQERLQIRLYYKGHPQEPD